MFQSFNEAPVTPDRLKERFARVVSTLQEQTLDGYIISHSDAHQSEYLPQGEERLAYLTGFTGSAGWAVILNGKGALFIDGRYTEQAAKQADSSLFELVDVTRVSPSKWIEQNAAMGQKIGCHAFYLTISEHRKFNAACAHTGAELVSAADDIIDLIWDADGRSRAAPGMVSLQDVANAGVSASDKLEALATILTDRNIDASLVTLADSIAWLFNIRGRDVIHNPVPLAFALVKASGKPTLWIDGKKLTNSVRDTLAQIADVEEISNFENALIEYAQQKPNLLIDQQSCSEAVRALLDHNNAEIVEGTDPIIGLKARKNPVELEGMRRAHLRDGAAMVKFLYWLDQQPGGTLTEIEAATKLEELRIDTAKADGSALMEISFDTISAAGENAALPHYRVLHHHNARLENNSLYLVDSGGQYIDGTTDITRTIAIGTIDEERAMRFTQVLKGHIAIACARFPQGTSGAQLDTLARHALWTAGCDFAHGTGHGVGAYLCVHEGPARIAKSGHVPLEQGMILSNEPGYYKAGHFGIRLENLVVVEDPAEIEGGDMPMMAFETITFCPFDVRVIDLQFLSDQELDWLNDYHHDVFDKITHTDLLNSDEISWLSRATAPLIRKTSHNKS